MSDIVSRGVTHRVRAKAVGELFAAALIVLAVAACSGGDSSRTPLSAGPSTSFQRLQTVILEKSCGFTACHAPGNTGGSSLVLTGTDVYAHLVGATPKNTVARADRLSLVMPGKPDSSLLWHKLNGWISGHHSHDYGASMPQAGQSLSVEQLDFVRQWIERGASATDDGVNPQLLSGTTRPQDLPYTPLVKPASGYQLTLQSFSVKPSFERELFVYRPVGNTADVYVNRIQSNMRRGSHHFVLYTFVPTTPSFAIPAADQVRDIRNNDGTYNILNLIPMGYHLFFAGTQTQTSDYTFPPGVALRLPAGAMIDVNSHYVNSSAQDLVGEAEANLYTVPQSEVQLVASTLNLANTDLTLPQGRDTTISKTFKFTTTTRIVALTSHMHGRGQSFVIRISGGARNGEVVYTSTSWDHPPIISFATPIVLQAGEGLTSSVTYKGDPSKVVRFGLTSDDEMDIIFGYWY